ncbi:MAG: HEAT repeat domain-containing protein [Planctomycetota bacterium]|jgi:HEAT repeat protein
MTPNTHAEHVLTAAVLAFLAGACAPAWETGETFGGRTVSAWIRVIDRDEGVLEPATAAALWQIARQSKDAPGAFASVFGSADEDERMAAIRAIEEFALVDKGACRFLVEALRDPAEINRGVAEATLWELAPADEEDIDRLVAELASGEASACLHAAFLVGQVRRDRHRLPILIEEDGPDVTREVEALAKALSDPDRDVRRYAALALAEIGAEARLAAREVTAALADPYAPVRAEAACAWGRMRAGGDASVRALLPLLSDPVEEVRVAAVRALAGADVEGKASVHALLPLLADPSAEMREAAAEALSDIVPATADAVPPLARALTDSNEFVRSDAAHALHEMGALARPAVPALTRVLGGPDWTLRDAAARALAAIINPDDVPLDAPKVSGLDVTVAVLALAGALRDEEELVRDSAVDALADIGPRARAAESALAERFERSALDGSDVRKRLDIARALDSVSPDSIWTVGAFRDLLGATRPPDSSIEDEDIGRSAAWALVKKGPSVLGVLRSALASDDSHRRASAAAGLGWLARGRRLAPGSGFSDLPVGTRDPDAPLGLDAEETAAIVEPLTRSLGDAEAEARAAAAQALGDIGAASAPAFDRICHALADPSADVRRGAVWALEGLGPRAAPAVPLLTKVLDDNDSGVRLRAVMALGTIAPDSREATLALAGRLGDENYGVRNRAGDMLAMRGKGAVGVLADALRKDNTDAHSEAARALAQIGGEAVAAGPALIEALNGTANVLDEVFDAVAKIRPSPERVVPILLRLAGSSANGRVRRRAMEALGAYGEGAKAALPLLTAALRDDDEDTVEAAVAGIAGIGADAHAARVLLELDVSDDECLQLLILKALTGRPADALGFLNAHPEFLRESSWGGRFLVKVLLRTDGEGEALRRAIRARDDLPATIMVRTGDRSFLPAIEKRMATASQHGRTLLAACARALGGRRSPVERVVDISETDPGDFRPPSNAGLDRRRMPRGTCGHGDGTTDVIVTGRLLMHDGRAAVNPRFFDLNDRFMLGARRKSPAKIKYSPETGRFIFVTSVFAAYATGRGPREPGPYQTGSALVLIEVEGAKPLRVRFFDEMPDVEITLTPAE